MKWVFPNDVAKHLPEAGCRMDLTIQRHQKIQQHQTVGLLGYVDSRVVDSRHSVCSWFSAWAWIHPATSEPVPSVPSWVEVFVHKKSRLFLPHLVAILWPWPWTCAPGLGCRLRRWWKDIRGWFSTWLCLLPLTLLVGFNLKTNEQTTGS